MLLFAQCHTDNVMPVLSEIAEVIFNNYRVKILIILVILIITTIRALIILISQGPSNRIFTTSAIVLFSL